MLTVVVIIIIIGLTGVAIYSLTSTSTFTQLISQNTSKAYYLAESGFRVVASEYNNAGDPKNTVFENLHGTTLTLPDNSGAFDIRLYPYWFYVDSLYTMNDASVVVKMPGGIPLRNPEDTTSPRISIPGSGQLKLQGKTQLATISASAVGGGDIVTFFLVNPGFPYTIQTDEEILLAYSDNTTNPQNNIVQGGDLDLPGNNAIAQILPARNGSFRIYNENNDVMDYTYREKVPAIVDPGNPPTTSTLSGVGHQDADDPSVFPFSIDGNSEIYFGRNLAVFTTATSGAGTTASTKTIGEYTDVGLDGGFSTGKDTISFEEDIADFNPTMGKAGGDLGGGDPKPIEVNVTNKEIELGQNLTGHYGSVWYKGDTDIANCIEGKCLLGKGIRAFFEFEFDDTDDHVESKAYGDGFTFALISGDNYTDGDTGEGGEYLGYAGAGSGSGLSGNGIQPPKIGIEIDTYPNPGAGNICGSNSRRDDTPVANHLAAVYWGEENMGSLFGEGYDNNGGWVRIGAQNPNDGDPEDWSSSAGTISFWFNRLTKTTTNTSDVGDRMWGQDGDMEMRFSGANGSEINLDWGQGGQGAIQNLVHTFTQTNHWYFMAITWNDNTNVIRIYWADQNNSPTLLGENTSWAGNMSSAGLITENLFLNSSGGNQTRQHQIHGNGTELRYYDVERSLTDIQADYDERLSDNETGLQAYFPLHVDLANAGPLSLSASIVDTVGPLSWSTDTPSVFSCGTGSDPYDDNRHGAGGTTSPMNSYNSDNTNGNDGYHQVTGSSPNWLEDGSPHLFRIELIRPLEDDPVGSGNYKYQMKIWIDCNPCSTGELAQFKDVRADFSVLAPQIKKTIKDTNNPLVLNATDHDELKRILFGFTEGTGGATQDITLRNFELYFLRRYPVSDLSTW